MAVYTTLLRTKTTDLTTCMGRNVSRWGWVGVRMYRRVCACTQVCAVTGITTFVWGAAYPGVYVCVCGFVCMCACARMCLPAGVALLA